jgi:hypothetical protein
MTFMPNFVKLGPLVQELKGGSHTQHGDLIGLFLSRKERRRILEPLLLIVFEHGRWRD